MLHCLEWLQKIGEKIILVKKLEKQSQILGGMIPEEMPTLKKSLKELEREKKQLEIKEQKKLEGTAKQ